MVDDTGVSFDDTYVSVGGTDISVDGNIGSVGTRSVLVAGLGVFDGAGTV